MPVTREQIEQYFSAGETLLTGGQTAYFRILRIDDKGIKIDKISSLLKYSALSLVVDNFKDLVGQSIERAIKPLLKANGLKDDTGEVYLLGMAREYLNRQGALSWDDSEESFETAVDCAQRKMTPEELLAAGDRQALSGSNQNSNTGGPRVPRHRRNPFYAARALIMAQGVCQECKKSAPFLKRSNGDPFLEVHHVDPLSKGGPDIPGNMTALCPNCHRKAHHG